MFLWFQVKLAIGTEVTPSLIARCDTTSGCDMCSVALTDLQRSLLGTSTFRVKCKTPVFKEPGNNQLVLRIQRRTLL